MEKPQKSIEFLTLEIPEAEQLTQEEIEVAFAALIDKQESGYEGKPRRKPVIVKMFLDFFRNSEYKRVRRLSEAIELFIQKKYSYPSQSTSSKINKINKALQEIGVDIEIHTETVIYLRRRPKD